MKTKIFLLLVCVLGLMACTNEDTPLPTGQPTLAPLASPVPDTVDTATRDAAEATALSPTLEATGEAGSLDIPANSTVEADPALPEIDQAVCAEALETQAELESLQEQGQDVAELATAVAELVGEMSQCASFYTLTPLP
jgi:hypothetical protein